MAKNNTQKYIFDFNNAVIEFIYCNIVFYSNLAN
ncbi:hypothetical protein HD_0429 [[Haemophilus] ducreyi 35000HP]|uniref:Uncharacterized protein n=1 Tax=Haemophilus ducreyi (strain 35000HP / ATCC 700724) TaxID=233412 RepID=Q7VNQ8_HAEDU|nr:hypothetical protein HD_0429 [[Haemophilus] ducreyi 35000HP]